MRFKSFLKKIEKISKKVLTKGFHCDIIVERRKERSKNRSLKIEQQEESTSIEHGEIHVLCENGTRRF